MTSPCIIITKLILTQSSHAQLSLL